jgi:hypothetical protein
MENQFSEMEQSIIRNMMASKSVKDIARMVDSNVGDVAAFIKAAVEGTGIVTYQMRLDAKKMAKPAKAPKPAKAKKKKISAAALLKIEQAKKEKEQAYKIKMAKHKEALAARDAKVYQRRPPNYKTIVVDYTKLQTVRIDRKTVIYAKPGENIEALKKRFLKNYGSKVLKENEC